MNLKRSEFRELIVAEGVRHPRRNVSRGTSGTFLFRLRLRGWSEIMEQQVAALIQQVMEMSERMLQSSAAEQARQLLEAHRSAARMLERLDRAEATATTDTSLAGGIRPGRAQVPEARGVDDGRFGFGAFAARYQPERASVPRTLLGVTGPGCFVLGRDGFNVDESKKSSKQWTPYLETKRL